MQYRTDEVPAAQRFEYWREVVSAHHCWAETSTDVPANFEATLDARSLGALGLSHIRCGTIAYDRDCENLRRAPGDDYLFNLLLSGKACLSQNDRHTVQKAGDMVFYDTARPFEYSFDGQYEMLILRVPRKALDCKHARLDNVTARTMSRQSAAGQFLASMIENSFTLSGAQSTDANGRIGNSLTDILAVTLENEFTQAETLSHHQHTLLQRTQAFMLNHLDDSELSMETIGRQVGASPRTLSRLFASINMTPMQWMWHQRLEKSYQFITEGRARQVADVAVSCGFTSFAHFSRAFKKQYGHPPSQLMRRN
ncbi:MULTISPECIES: helix-turn-helix domain-containing protein [Enterobacteriaceae]|uniref:Helix-turn-helix domain-containing protein n=1 Tax=Kluyvera intermedia TaxID=61648 RepID=A0AA95FW89_KLUIN|nr:MULTISPECIES: helix-turn-helix domain-containing protein [Enterobacteriaceae]WGL54960.1 helix-turn-helix domain-containing protein [Kluyvera intermedia]SAS40482.1 AraC family transcriptional regulator [Klebsiella pneumoniae]HBY9439618.1 helix-turn-helix domain-containing protein [Klebsiella pneumoniae]HEO9805087.1 helix-turn-helix domain-containing protein [Klebsiella pneumoniae subsp. pneumoniae]